MKQPAVERFTLANLRSDDRRVLAGFLLALIVSCVGLIGCGDRDRQQASEVAPGAELVEVVPAHKIIEVNRWDRPDDQRRFYIIRLPEVYAEEQMLQVARWIVDDRHKKNDLVNAVTFQFLFPGTHGKYGSDGSIHWAPDGELSKSTTVTAGDYRTFRFRTVLYLKGLTAKEAEELLSVPVPGHVIGRWYEHGFLKSIMTIYSHEQKTYFKRQRSVEISSVEEILEVPNPVGRRFDRTLDSPGRGGHLVVTPDGDLHFFKRNGHRYQIATQVAFEGTTVSSP